MPILDEYMEYIIIVVLLGLVVYQMKKRRILKEVEYYRQIVVAEEFITINQIL